MGWILAVNDVAQGSAEGNFPAKVMVAVDELPEEVALRRCLDFPQLYGRETGKRPAD